jgi:hypothetical protein
MGSLFLNVGLVAGVALAAIPVILHLLMKQTPKRVVFPALRLIKERQKVAKKKLRLKHWLLLAARMALLALMALALARPRIDAKASLGDKEVPTALAFVFDTSLSMGYLERDKTRLDEAKRLAKEILSRSHESSQVFVIDGSEPMAPQAMTPASASKSIDALGLRVVTRPLNGAMGQAYKAVAGSDRPRREVYVLTDLSAAAWERGQAIEGMNEARAVQGGIQTFVLRLSVEEPRNVGVVDLQVGGSGPVAGEGPFRVRGRVRNTGPKVERVVGLWIDDQKKDQKPLELAAGGETETPDFLTPKLKPGLHQVALKLEGPPDALKVDDARYATLELSPPLKVLLISDRRIDAEFVAGALDPAGLPPGEPRPFEVVRVLSSKAMEATGRLRDYASVFLLNVEKLDPVVWNRLQAYVRDGGGLVVAPGEQTRKGMEGYNAGVAASLLPARLGAARDHAEAFFTFGKLEETHPLLAQSAASVSELAAQLARVPVMRTLEVTPVEGSSTIVSYQDGSPALLERTFPGPLKAGHVLLWTTPLARRPDPNSPEAWNEFPMPTAGWGFFALMNQTVPYLAGTLTRKLTVEAGEDVLLSVDSAKRLTGFSVIGPESKQAERLNAPLKQGTLVVAQPAQIGPWKVLGTGPDGTSEALGFSVNVPASEMDLRTVDAGELDTILGKDQYGLADGPEGLKREVMTTRYGRELFPWLMMAILVLVTIENALANRFYKETGAGRTSGAGAGAQPATAA